MTATYTFDVFSSLDGFGSVSGGETTSTVNSSPGSFTFHTSYIFQCTEFGTSGGAEDVLNPSPGVAIRHVRGKTWCQHFATDKGKTLSTVGATLTLKGTTFGLDASPEGTEIKVITGEVVATSLATKQVVTIPAGSKRFIPVAGSPGSLEQLALAGDDEEAATFIALKVFRPGSRQVVEYVHAAHQKSLVIVGADETSAKLLATVVHDIKFTVILADQVSPNALLGRLKGIGARTLAVTGPFSAARPLLAEVRDRVPAIDSVLFVPTTG